ncbi:hypothetical protein AMATHDRAFT_137711 [Amanita thiersii Skay4041]|uniref:Carboxypeptidase n=1 Tax=Amanita thiersii Skay4041 TaxID=703135 RepID=A0A2A9NQM3_9AGAR|nr:hypothetical protein AMATHDRAFT_137711 [Amanita thiersii Skay4041]
MFFLFLSTLIAVIEVIGGILTSAYARETPTATPGQLRNIVENSGLCETTPSVYQASGYADLTSTKSLWFWYFAARKNPSIAPLVLYVDGGPGVSSMTGLLQEHGPCRINNDTSSVNLNPYSWNNEVNIIYLDQPVTTGFSIGSLDVDTSQKAASDTWKFMQIFLKDPRFTSLLGREFGIWTQSYGGHYGPTFSAHFLAQNDAIDAGNLGGIRLKLKYLGIGSGLTDPLLQYPSYITYAAHNPYHPLTTMANVSLALRAFTKPGGCKNQIESCYHTNSSSVCSAATEYCNNNILFALGDEWNMYYVLAKNPNPYPPDITGFLDSIAARIGAEKKFAQGSLEIVSNFMTSGDWMRNSRQDLETTIKAGVRTLIYVGDADYIVNYMGIEAMACYIMNRLETQYTDAYRQAKFQQYTVRGERAGLFKNAGKLSYLRIYGAGHLVPAYGYCNLKSGEVAAQMFTQIMANRSLSPS